MLGSGGHGGDATRLTRGNRKRVAAETVAACVLGWVRGQLPARSRRPSPDGRAGARCRAAPGGRAPAAARCWCWPGPAPGRPPRWSRRRWPASRPGVPVEQLLMLTFSRRAAGELRDRVTARLGRTVREPVARTLHSYAFGVLRLANLAQGLPAPRLLSGPEQDVILRELVAGRDPSGWPAELRPALRTRAFAGELRDLLMRAVERGLDGPGLAALGRRPRPARLGGGRAVPRRVPRRHVAGASRRLRPGRAHPLGAGRVRPRPRACWPTSGRAVGTSSSTSTRTPTRRRPNCSRCSRPAPTSWSSSATPTSRSTPSAAPTSPRSATSTARFGRGTRGADGRPAGLAPRRARAAGRLAPRRRPAARAGRAAPPESPRRAPRGARQRRRRGLPHGQRGGHLPGGCAARGPPRRAALVADGGAGAFDRRAARRPAPCAGHGRRAGLGAGRGPPARRTARRGRCCSKLLQCVDEPARLTEDVAERLLLGPVGGADIVYLRRLRRVLRGLVGPDEPVLLAPALLDELGARGAARARPHARSSGSRAVSRRRPRGGARRGRRPGGRALGGVVGLRARFPVAGGERGRRDQRRRRRPRPRRSGRTVRRRGPLRRPAARRDARRLHRAPGRPADPGRHAGHPDRRTARRSPCSPRTPPRVWNGISSASPTCRRAAGRTCAGAARCWAPSSSSTSSPAGTRPRVLAGPQLAEERRLFYVAATRARQRLVVTAVAGDEEQPSRFLDELDPVDGERPLTGVPRATHLSALVAELRAVVCDPARRPARPGGRGRAAGPAGRGGRARRGPRPVVGARAAVRRRPGGRSRPAGADQPVADRRVPALRAARAAAGSRRP